MPPKKESLLRRAVSEALRPLHVVPYENGIACPGTPDLDYEGDATWAGFDRRHVRGWIELKTAKYESPTKAIQIKLQPGQRAWWAQRLQAGGRVSVLVRVSDVEGAWSSYLWFEGSRDAPDMPSVRSARLDRLYKLATDVRYSNYSIGFADWIRNCVAR